MPTNYFPAEFWVGKSVTSSTIPSTAFLAKVRTNHTAVSRLTVEGVVLNPTGGQVTDDYRRDVRRQFSASFVDPDRTLTPQNATDLLTPYGHEVLLERGVLLDDGTIELIQLGVFRITKSKVKEDEKGLSIQIEGLDRSTIVARNRWIQPTQIGSASLSNVLQTLLQDRYPAIQFNFDSAPATVPLVTLESGESTNPWGDAVKLAESYGYDLYFAGDGSCRLEQMSTGAVTPARTYAEGADMVITTLEREWDAESTYNGVIAQGAGTEVPTPVWAEAWDENPASPTYRYGEFGHVPRFYSSEYITSTAQAQTTARALLQKEIGLTESLTWTQICDPSLRSGLTIQVQRSQVVDALYVLDSLTIPLTGSGMSATARTRTVTL